MNPLKTPTTVKFGHSRSPFHETASNNNLIKEEIMEKYAHSLSEHLIQLIMGTESLNTKELKDLLKEFILQPRFAHGEIIKENDPYFRCLDCEILKHTNQKTYLCRSCFEKGHHKGHRFLLFNDTTGNETCDCGNEGLLDRRGFCSEHGTCAKEDYQRVISVVPINYLKNFNKVIKQVIYELVFVCEAYLKDKQSGTKLFIDKVLDALLEAFMYFVNLNPIFIVLISEIISHPLKHPKHFKKKFILIEDLFVKRNLNIITKNIYVSYIGNLIRHSSLFKQDLQKKFRETLLKLACAEEFKKKLVLDFHKEIDRLFYIKPNTPFRFSNVSFLSIQLYASEEDCLRVINEESFDHLISTLKEYARNFELHLDPDGEVLARILHPFELILEKQNAGCRFVQKKHLVEQFLSVIAEFQRKYTYDIKDLMSEIDSPFHCQNIIGYWDFEAQLFEVIGQITKNVKHALNNIQWEQDFHIFLTDWGEYAKKGVELDRNFDKIHLNLPLQRAIVVYLQNCLERIDKNAILKLLRDIEKTCPEAIEHLIGQAIATIGAMRRCMIELVENDIEANNVVHEYFAQDGLGDASFFDYDFLFVQLFSLLLNKEDSRIFELYYKAFFNYDKKLIEIFEEARFENATEHQLQIFEDFFNFIVQVIHGEVSFFNIFSKSPLLTDHSSKKLIDQIHRKILTLFLHKSYDYYPIANLKKDFQYILRKDIFHEKIIKDLAEIDKESKKFKLKKEYQNHFDSFYLYPDRLINTKIIYNVRLSNERAEIAEIGSFSESLTYCDILQQRVYEDKLLDWIGLFISKFILKSKPLIPVVIRLIEIPLKLLEKRKMVELEPRFMEKMSILRTKGFLEELTNALLSLEIPSAKYSIDNIIKILNSITGKNDLIDTLLTEEDKSEILSEGSSVYDIPAVSRFMYDESDLVCGICKEAIDLSGKDLGIPTYVSCSNVNYWELTGRKVRRSPHNADRETIKVIIDEIKKYSPYAEGLNPHEIDLVGGYVPPRLKQDFYPALTSCMHYMHRSCFKKNIQLIPDSSQEFECPMCKKLNNTFFGMEKVDAAARNIIEQHIKENKKFIGFLKKQGVFIAMLPDPSLRFDFYNNFMNALFPHNSTLKLKQNDPATDQKILKFTNLMRASFFQLIRNSMIYNFETFMKRSYMCYKFSFINMQSFVMKNYQFHELFEKINKMVDQTIFHVLNHAILMGKKNPPTMKELYELYKGEMGLDEEKENIKKKEIIENKKKQTPELKPIQHHRHLKTLPKLPTDGRGKVVDTFKMNGKNRQIMLTYNSNKSLKELNELIFESQDVIHKSSHHIKNEFHKDTEKSSINTGSKIKGHFETIKSKESIHEDYKEEELFDSLQKMLLLFENETEEDFFLVFWESFLKFLLTNQMKDQHTNIDLETLAIDFLYLRSLAIMTRMLLSERVIKMRQNNLPDLEEMQKTISSNGELRSEFLTEMLNLTQKLVVSCILIFDFDKCVEITNELESFREIKGDKELALNYLLGLIKKDLTINVILSTDVWKLKENYKNFFYVWRENLTDFLKKTRNPFELSVKNIVEIKPLMIELPSNFNEFNSEYLPKKCDLCKEFCKTCKTVVCLLCGVVMCKNKCIQLQHKINKDKKKKKKRRAKRRIHNLETRGSTDSDSCEDSMELEKELLDSLATPDKLGPIHLKGTHHKERTFTASSGSASAKLQPSSSKREHRKNLTQEQFGVEVPRETNESLSPVFSENFTTPIKPNKPLTGSGVRKTDKNTLPSLTKTQHGREENFGLRTKNLSHVNLTTERTTNGARTTQIPSLDQFTTEKKAQRLTKTQNIDENIQTKKKKKRIRRVKIDTNMHKHAEEIHKGHTVYIGIQDQSIILFSSPREVKYHEKLYVDRFGQDLKEKANVFEEDWHSFKTNSNAIKRIKEAVENHSLPQLVYSLMLTQNSL